MPDNPRKQTSDEVDERQLELAKRAGETYMEAVEYMATEVAHTGDHREAGEMIVAFAQEEAEGMYALEGQGEFEWIEPGDDNCHVEVTAMDAEDKRMIPELDVEFTLERDGEEFGPHEADFLWHPGLFHYGKNVELPEGGTYDLHVEIDAPTFMRHDEQNGDRYGEDVSVTFEDVDVETGQD